MTISTCRFLQPRIFRIGQMVSRNRRRQILNFLCDFKKRFDIRLKARRIFVAKLAAKVRVALYRLQKLDKLRMSVNRRIFAVVRSQISLGNFLRDHLQEMQLMPDFVVFSNDTFPDSAVVSRLREKGFAPGHAFPPNLTAFFQCPQAFGSFSFPNSSGRMISIAEDHFLPLLTEAGK